MWFELSEYQARLGKCQKFMAHNNLDYLLVFEPELVTYLTGFYTFGYLTSYQFAVVPASGLPVAVIRKAEEYHFKDTAAWKDSYLMWFDGESAVDVTKRALAELFVKGRVGFEGASWRANTTIMDGVRASNPAQFVDFGAQIDSLRFIKSQAEIAYMREAGKVCDLMQAAAIEAANPGASERDIMIAASTVGLRAGNDWPDAGPIASGERAYHIHMTYGDRVLENNDIVFLEMTPHHKQYHARSMRTILLGEHDKRMPSVYQRFVDAQNEAFSTLKAGVHCSVPDRIIRDAVLSSGWVDQYPNKSFYGIGMMLHPNTYEKLEVTKSADFYFEAGMTFHAYISANGLNISESIVITEDGFELLTQFDRSLVIK